MNGIVGGVIQAIAWVTIIWLVSRILSWFGKGDKDDD